MFTGLIETMGTIVGIRPYGRGAEFCIKADLADYYVDAGGSVSVDGVCLTVEKLGDGGFMYFTAVAETLKRTTFDRAVPGRRVNLERALKVGGRLDGHFVLGHADAVGRIAGDEDAGAGVVRTVVVPEGLSPFMAEKGSVAVDGISLTIAKVSGGAISLSLIPATIGKTTMSVKRAGDSVNIECDVLARYMRRMMETGFHVCQKESLVDKMERLGF
jgi:riboflavin synthase